MLISGTSCVVLNELEAFELQDSFRLVPLVGGRNGQGRRWMHIRLHARHQSVAGPTGRGLDGDKLLRRPQGHVRYGGQGRERFCGVTHLRLWGAIWEHLLLGPVAEGSGLQPWQGR